jgi:hypothetical protein
MMYDLTSDPGERWNLFATKLDNSWIMWPLAREISKYEMSVKKYRNSTPEKGSKVIRNELMDEKSSLAGCNTASNPVGAVSQCVGAPQERELLSHVRSRAMAQEKIGPYT